MAGHLRAADGSDAESEPAWRKKGFERNWLKNIAHLVSGSSGNAMLMLASTIIAARTLGPAAYGALALILTVGRLSERLLRFESWQPLIRFAASEEVNDDPKRMSELYLYGLLLDTGTAICAALLTVILGYALMSVIGLSPEHIPMIAIYAIAIATNIRGVPTAALRFDGKFRTLAYVQLLSSLVRLCLVTIGLMLGFSLLEFVIIWTACQILDSLLFLWLGTGSRYSAGERLGRFRLGGFLSYRQTYRQGCTTGRRDDASSNLSGHGANVGKKGLWRLPFHDNARSVCSGLCGVCFACSVLAVGRVDNAGCMRPRIYRYLSTADCSVDCSRADHACSSLALGAAFHESLRLCALGCNCINDPVFCYYLDSNAGIRCTGREYCTYRVCWLHGVCFGRCDVAADQIHEGGDLTYGKSVLHNGS